MLSKYLFFACFMAFILLILLLDLGLFHKKDHEIKLREAVNWSIFWIMLGVAFSLVLYYRADWVHGITDMEGLLDYVKGTPLDGVISASMNYQEALELYRQEVGSQYLAGYFLEKSLSIDNIFVMILVFSSFGIEKKYYHRVLFWGIMGAIVLRFIFIFSLGALLDRFTWILAIFGVILVYSGIKMFFQEDEEQIDTANHPVVRFASKYFRVSRYGKGHDFLIRIDGKTFITPLFLVLMVIEFSDIVFAVDSIPAVFSVTTDSYIVYFSNIFAILGLRSLFFLMSNVTDMFWLLKYGLGVLLSFIGVKMIGHEFFHLNISTSISLMVILGILSGSIIFSLIFPKKAEKAE